MNLSEAPVSVVIPCYRCAGTIERAVASVAAQTVRPAEVILVDDCSGDGTLDVLRQLASRYAVGWIKIIALPSNRGAASARNAGWGVADRPYLAFLDADDSWHPQKIALQYAWMRENPDVMLSGHPMIESRAERAQHRPLAASEIIFRPVKRADLLVRNLFPTPSVMLRRSVAFRFVEGKRYSEDYLLWLLMVCSGAGMVRCDLPLAFLHKAAYGASGLSSHLWKMERGELDTYYRVWKSGGIGVASYVALSIYSLIRYVRRIFISAARA